MCVHFDGCGESFYAHHNIFTILMNIRHAKSGMIDDVLQSFLHVGFNGLSISFWTWEKRVVEPGWLSSYFEPCSSSKGVEENMYSKLTRHLCTKMLSSRCHLNQLSLTPFSSFFLDWIQFLSNKFHELLLYLGQSLHWLDHVFFFHDNGAIFIDGIFLYLAFQESRSPTCERGLGIGNAMIASLVATTTFLRV